MTQLKSDPDKLIGLFNEEKLKGISSLIIDAYRRHDHRTLGRYAANLDIKNRDLKEKPAMAFRKMMLYYHPDRRAVIHKKIRQWAEAGRSDLLEKLERSINGDFTPPPRPEAKRKKAKSGEDFTFREEYASNPFNDDFARDDFIHTKSDTTRTFESETFEFIEAVRSMMYGNLPGEFLPKDLYHLDGELDLREEGIVDLSGLEYCINITELVLSRNSISNINDLSELVQLVSLDLSFNDITYVDELSSLSSLVNLDLSFNSIEDVTPLIQLTELRYLNLIGNPVRSEKAIKRMRSNGIIVLCDN